MLSHHHCRAEDQRSAKLLRDQVLIVLRFPETAEGKPPPRVHFDENWPQPSIVLLGIEIDLYGLSNESAL